MVTYGKDWAYSYASRHWTGLDPLVPGESFLGAFTGREAACQLAESRGYWAALQLDDNIDRLCLFRRNTKTSGRMLAGEGGLGFFADVLAAIAQSTNGAMVGAFLTSVPPTDRKIVISRTGFPYSLFLEKTGPDRERWYGPYEDDITHAYAYGNNPLNQAPIIVPLLAYTKEFTSKSGMRGKYDSTRSVTLQRMFPQTASIGIRASKSNGKGGPRVFHKMVPGAIRTPQIITDKELYGQVADYLTGLAKDYSKRYRADLEAKVAARAARSGLGPI